ncbi:MAG TPA: cytochrome P450 [Dehalococcoidia bacterium]|jgi:cholest-4-en-3-one 26-monooxygenase|nr:cytochrome P450 [Dehalococcoidia bacterium]
MTSTKEHTLTLADVDLFDPGNFVDGVPHHFFKLLRKEAPVYRHPEPGGPGFWALTKYDDIVTVSMDPATFSSEQMGTNIPDPPQDSLTFLRMIMLNMDPPKHTKYRRLVSKGFTPKIVLAMEPHVRKIANEIIDRVATRGECDFVTDIAAELPLQVILELMGVPVEDRHLVFDWSNRMIGFDDPDYQTSPEQGRAAATDMFMYANQLAVDRKHAPRDDVISTLMRAEMHGEALTEGEFNAFFVLLSVAGNETTRNLTSGGMLALLEHPNQRDRLLAVPSMLPLAVEEMLRWVTPVIYFRRTVMRDTEIRGQKIREGDKVAMYYGSANRDEDVFPDGDVFDVSRNPNPHVTFGPGGSHFCLGASLARLEIRVMFEEMLRRLPDIELTGPVRRLRSNFIAGIKQMPVRFSPENGSAKES